jgi:hypothetical protein
MVSHFNPEDGGNTFLLNGFNGIRNQKTTTDIFIANLNSKFFST